MSLILWLDKLNTYLFEDVKEKEKQKRIFEFKALQAQINPHFLFNTLNSIKWMAELQRADNIQYMVTALLKLLHLSMGKGEEFLPCGKSWSMSRTI